jgi:catechol 2,3-dioxygenase-like lactoylglutathione lyase family enzyme
MNDLGARTRRLAQGNRVMTKNDAGRHKVLGLGGVFVRARDPKALAVWYREHLGFDVHDFGGAFGAIFPFADRELGYQLWTAFPADTKKFGSTAQPQMLNFRVADLDGLLAQLRAGGVTVEDKVERSEYGNFGWCLDGEGNRVELWQPPES